MEGKVLVAYATRYGSTGEVAGAVGKRLTEQGLAVDVKPVKETRSLNGYDAVVFGAPFYLGSMLKEGRKFLEQQRAALEDRPIAIFALGPTSADDDLAEASKQLAKALGKMPWLKPVAAEMFVGKYDPAKLRLADKVIAAPPASPLHGLGAHDDRDWDAIGEWAEELEGLRNPGGTSVRR
jgi:menaquinone-dependent protoporphyrinogen oxidase